MQMKTFRQLAIEDAHKSAHSLNLSLKLSAHFIDRVNIRSPNQDETFKFFAKCVSHAFKNWKNLGNKKVAYRDSNETLVIKIQPLNKEEKAEIIILTYYFNAHPHNPGEIDVMFQVAKSLA